MEAAAHRHKDFRDIVVRTLFATLYLPSPGWRRCPCSPSTPRTFRRAEPSAGGGARAARAALRAKTGTAQTVRGNRVSAGRLQLCLGRDLRWCPYARSDQDWEPSGSPDPARALQDL
jgi:hypothetical protein